MPRSLAAVSILLWCLVVEACGGGPPIAATQATAWAQYALRETRAEVSSDNAEVSQAIVVSEQMVTGLSAALEAWRLGSGEGAERWFDMAGCVVAAFTHLVDTLHGLGLDAPLLLTKVVSAIGAFVGKCGPE